MSHERNRKCLECSKIAYATMDEIDKGLACTDMSHPDPKERYSFDKEQLIYYLKYIFVRWLCNLTIKIIGRACVTRIVTKEGHDLSGLKLIETSDKDWNFKE